MNMSNVQRPPLRMWGPGDHYRSENEEIKAAQSLHGSDIPNRISERPHERPEYFNMTHFTIKVWTFQVKYIFGQKKKNAYMSEVQKARFLSPTAQNDQNSVCREKNEFQESSNLLLSSAAHSQLLRDNSWKHLVLKQQRRSQNNSDIAVFLKDNELR